MENDAKGHMDFFSISLRAFLASPCVCSRFCFMYRNCLHSIFPPFFRDQHARAEPPTTALRTADDAAVRRYPTKPRS